ncbi:MAG: glycosyltransferase [Acidobacteriota bacterium]|nr:glycosyltransferase [Acidobacteriota bacterium]
MKLAIVTPWFGKNLIGGAEQQAYQVALRLAARGHNISVLTTCSLGFQEDWATNHLSPGQAEESGITVWRFPVDARNAVAFDKLNAQLLSQTILSPGVNILSVSEVKTFVNDSINSSALLDHLRSHEEDYQAFLFIPYMFGVILQGLPLVAHKAFLQPCLHDEAYAYLAPVERMFRLAKRLIFNSEGEAHLAATLYGPGIFGRTVVVGEGIEAFESPEQDFDDDAIENIGGTRYVFYLGRRDATKNVDLLVSAFAKFKQNVPESEIKLVLAGPGTMSFGDAVPDVVDLGVVSEKEKDALLTNSLALFQPSKNESYSRVIMEAWRHGRPVVANGDCLATANFVKESSGGWVATTEAEWAEMFAQIESLPPVQLNAAGERGRRYADVNADWETVMNRYEQALDLVSKRGSAEPAKDRSLSTIHQLLPDLSFGDAISNQAIAIRDRLRSLGYASEILVKNLEKRMEGEGRRFEEGCLDDDAGLIYHHSIGTELTTHAVQHPGPKLLVYHNITPAQFYEPYRPGFAWLLERGCADLQRLSAHFPLSIGDSAFNAAELATYGFVEPAVLPIAVNPDKWNTSPDPELMKQLQDGITNVLFVGRIAPNKRQDQLVKAFASLRSIHPSSRLIIVGDGKDFDPYYQYLLETIAENDLTDHVIVAGQISDAELQAYYRTAHLYWSMSEHEGFCVPIVEAMWFDVPVLAYESTAVPETLADAGLMFSRKDDLNELAALAKNLVTDRGLRESVLAAQRRRRESFLPEVVWKGLDELLEKMNS